MNSFSKLPKIILLTIVFLLVFLFLIKLNYDNVITKPNSNVDEKISIEIKEGESVNSILENLIGKGLLQKKYYYYTKVYLKINDLETKLQAGNYELPKQLSIVELMTALQSGKDFDTWISIPEGLRKDEIAERIEAELSKNESSVFSKEEFLSLTENIEFISSLGLNLEVTNLEGFLFPDRYAFAKDTSTADVLKTLIENFKNKVGTKYTYQDIILASIVEREGYNKNDRPVIAGIIIKRFEEGWLLQTDATLLYPVKDWKHVITIQDKENDNPYNTYKKIGLPPTPICNPGLESIKAVWESTESKYYYYIHDKDGYPHYGETLEDHNANVSEYLR